MLLGPLTCWVLAQETIVPRVESLRAPGASAWHGCGRSIARFLEDTDVLHTAGTLPHGLARRRCGCRHGAVFLRLSRPSPRRTLDIGQRASVSFFSFPPCDPPIWVRAIDRDQDRPLILSVIRPHAMNRITAERLTIDEVTRVGFVRWIILDDFSMQH